VAGWNEEAECERPAPSITSLEVPNERVGYEAARLLDRLIDQQEKRSGSEAGEPAPKTILLPPVGIVARCSTDFFAVDDELVRRALRFIDTNLHKPLHVGMVADAVDVSKRTLESRFRNKLHRTVSGEIQRLRIERTKRQLSGTDQPVKHIGRQVGFGSARALNVAFRAVVGCTPTEYRQHHGHCASK